MFLLTQNPLRANFPRTDGRRIAGAESMKSRREFLQIGVAALSPPISARNEAER